jgi:hypothetical protein
MIPTHSEIICTSLINYHDIRITNTHVLVYGRRKGPGSILATLTRGDDNQSGDSVTENYVLEIPVHFQVELFK